MTDTNRHIQRRSIIEDDPRIEVASINWDPDSERVTFHATNGDTAILQLPVDPERIIGLTDVFHQPITLPRSNG